MVRLKTRVGGLIMAKPKPIGTGDLVYVKNNISWGTRPMRVTTIYQAAALSASCLHPDYGNGSFQVSNLVLASEVSKVRKAKLKKLQIAEKQVSKLTKQLFLGISYAK